MRSIFLLTLLAVAASCSAVSAVRKTTSESLLHLLVVVASQLHMYSDNPTSFAAVPVVFHVIHSGKEGNVSRATIQSTLNYANEVYQKVLGLSFTLSEVTRTKNTTW